ncbi:MAG: WYL domain-containing protein, partial [Actinomycetia bacterium]|nr:WYL domain-containing protein [Actinomycetes bacterium]
MPDLSVGHLEALFAVLSSLKRHDVIAIDKLAERLGVEAPELRRDLELLQYSGVPPFGGGDLLPIELEDDVLMVTGAMPALDRPLRLGLEQALALVLALEIAGYAPDDELVAKLSQGAPKLDLAQIARTLRAGLAGHTTAVFEAVTEALTEDRALQIDYRRSDGELTSRTVEPLLLFTEGDQWYVCAHCRLRGRVLNFRLSRIETAELGEVLAEVLAEVDRERGGDRGSGTVSHLKCDTVPDPLSPPLSLSTSARTSPSSAVSMRLRRKFKTRSRRRQCAQTY